MPDLDKSKTITVSVMLQPMAPLPPPIPGAPPISVEELEANHGADPVDVQANVKHAEDAGLTVVGVDAGKRTVEVSGTIAQIESAYNAEMEQWPTPIGEHRFVARAAEPASHLKIAAVLGMESAPFAKPHNRVRQKNHPHAQGARPLGPVETSRRYGVVSRTVAAGKTCQAAILCLGGGYTASDLAAACQVNGIAAPTIIDHSVSGATNSPGSNADVELMLDIIQIAGAYFARTGRPAAIHVFFSPNTDAGFVGGCLAATHSGLVCALSISWGSAESNWSAQAIGQFDLMAKGAGALGVTVTAATGDDGANDGTGSPVADYPSASPYIIGMSGTALTDTETTWDSGSGGGATGGAVSRVETPQPPWQSDYPAMGGRCNADLAANADPATCGTIVVNGQSMDIGGTSAAAPFMAGTVCWMCEELPQNVGYVNPVLQTMPTTCFTDITTGGNNGFNAGPGPDLCTGRGSPRPMAMLTALQGSAPPPGNGNPPPPPPPGTTGVKLADVLAIVNPPLDQLVMSMQGHWMLQGAARAVAAAEHNIDAKLKALPW